MSGSRDQAAFAPREALRILSRRKWLLLLPIFLTSVAALGGSFFIPPQYESSLLVWIGNPVKLTRDLERLIGQFQDIVLPERSAQRDVREYARQIASIPYAAGIMDKLNLGDNSELTQSADEAAERNPDLTPRDRTVVALRAKLAESIHLEFVTNSHLKISAKSADPYEARDIAQAVGEVFVEEQARQELKLLFLSLTFTTEQLTRYEKELQQTRDEKTELEKEISKWQTDNSLTVDANRNDLSSEIERRNQEIGDVRERETVILAKLDRLGRSGFSLEEPRSLRQKKQQIADLVKSVEELIQDHPWKDPTVNNLALKVVRLEDDVENAHELLVREQFANLQSSVQEDVVELLNVRHRLEVLDLYVTALRDGVEGLERKRSSLPEFRAKLEQIDRELKAKEALRDQFRVQQEGFEISQDLIEETRFQIVEDARVQSDPVWPDRRIILGGGLIVGLIIGAAAIFVVEYSDRSLKDAETAEDVLGLPVLGVVPKIEQTR